MGDYGYAKLIKSSYQRKKLSNFTDSFFITPVIIWRYLTFLICTVRRIAFCYTRRFAYYYCFFDV